MKKLLAVALLFATLAVPAWAQLSLGGASANLLRASGHLTGAFERGVEIALRARDGLDLVIKEAR